MYEITDDDRRMPGTRLGGRALQGLAGGLFDVL